MKNCRKFLQLFSFQDHRKLRKTMLLCVAINCTDKQTKTTVTSQSRISAPFLPLRCAAFWKRFREAIGCPRRFNVFYSFPPLFRLTFRCFDMAEEKLFNFGSFDLELKVNPRQ